MQDTSNDIVKETSVQHVSRRVEIGTGRGRREEESVKYVLGRVEIGTQERKRKKGESWI